MTSDRPVTTTYLEMRSAEAAVPFTGERRLEVHRVELPCPELNRFFYLAVGSDWTWYMRLPWGRAEWTAWADRPELETWIGYRAGTPVGYFELEHQPGPEVELAYFGLLPRFVGQGLGSELLSVAIARAWEPAPRRVWVHTCTLDHPRALENYQAQGFEVYRREEQIETIPDVRPGPWPEETT